MFAKLLRYRIDAEQSCIVPECLSHRKSIAWKGIVALQEELFCKKELGGGDLLHPCLRHGRRVPQVRSPSIESLRQRPDAAVSIHHADGG